MFSVPEEFRIKRGPKASTEKAGNNGVFEIYYHNVLLEVTASEAEGWECVSVRHSFRMPRWVELDYVRSIFWQKGALVVHYFDRDLVPGSEYTRLMWRQSGAENIFPRPPIYAGIPYDHQ